MTTDPQPRVGRFRHEASSPHHAISACVIQTVSGASHGLDMTVTQARALNLELSRAIVAYELIALDDPSAR
jgi:hypothetical protein